jgi:hypothetical protein
MMKAIIRTTQISQSIYCLRGQRVMLGQDLAVLYGVTAGALMQAVKRNSTRFPKDFVFQLTAEESANLKSQSVISSWGGRRSLPYAFMEQGVAMLSSVLRSARAGERTRLACWRWRPRHRELVSACANSLYRTRIRSRFSTWRRKGHANRGFSPDRKRR